MFQCAPSHLDSIYWSHTYTDIKLMTKLKVGHEQARVVQDYQTLAMVVSQALGGGKKSSDGAVKTKEEALSQFASVFGKKP